MDANWQLTGVPAYRGGRLMDGLYPCGSGHADDAEGRTPEDGFQQVIAETWREALTLRFPMKGSDVSCGF